MDFYNKHFHQLIRHVDPNGMLNVSYNVFSEKKCLDKYFRTNNDFRKLDVAWMCDQLIILLANFDDLVATTCTIQFLQNDFQRRKYPFVLISQAFIGLIYIQENSIKAYYSYCKNSTTTLYKSKIVIKKVHRKRKEKTPDISYQLHQEKIIQRQNGKVINQNQMNINYPVKNINEIEVNVDQPKQFANNLEIPEIIVTNQIMPNIPIPQNENTIPELNKNENTDGINKSDLGQLYIQRIEDFPIFDQNLIAEIPPLHRNEIRQLVTTELSENLEIQELIKQPQYSINIQDQQVQEIRHKQTHNIQQKHNLELIKNLTNQSLKRKTSNEIMIKKKFKRRPIEQSSKVLKKRLMKLEGELPDRPLECMTMKYIHKSMNHLPFRYATYCNKLNIPFAALTLNFELERNENLDDLVNKEMTMNDYYVFTEKLNCNNSIANKCIYQQCINNSLPHLSLLPLAEEYLTNNSLVWRDTINEINKKLEDSLKDISHIPKIDQSKWEEFKEKMKQRVHKSLPGHRTLVEPELSNIDMPEHFVILPSPRQIEELLNSKTTNENHIFTEIPQRNSNNINDILPHSELTEIGLPKLVSCNEPVLHQNNGQFNFNQDNCVVNHIVQDELDNFQNIVEPVEVCLKQSVNVRLKIFSILQDSPEKASCLVFTDLCPTHVTNRRYAIVVLIGLLDLHKKGIIALSQNCNLTNPSSIVIEIKTDNFF